MTTALRITPWKILEKEPTAISSELVRRERNGGSGAAVRDGLNKATGDYILFQDADLEYDPSEYRKLVRPVLERNADAVIGSRNLAPTYIRVHYFWHLVGNRIITLIFNLLYNLTFTDVYSLFTLSARLDYSWRTEERRLGSVCGNFCTIARRGNVFYEVPVNYAGRTYAEGKKSDPGMPFPVIWMIIKKTAWADSTPPRTDNSTGNKPMSDWKKITWTTLDVAGRRDRGDGRQPRR